MSRPVSYKFAAPTMRTKVTWIGTWQANGIGGAVGNNVTGWHCTTPQETIKRCVGMLTAGGGVVGNDCKDPAHDGYLNSASAAGAYGTIGVHNVRPLGWTEWMNLYRRCFVTGCKVVIYAQGAQTGGLTAGYVPETDGTNPPGTQPVMVELCASEQCNAQGAHDNLLANIWKSTGQGWGNPNAKSKVVTPRYNGGEKQLVGTWNTALSLYKTTKGMLGLKTIFGDENLSCNISTNTVRRWSMNWRVTGPGAINWATFTIRATYWCTFASRKAVAQAEDPVAAPGQY